MLHCFRAIDDLCDPSGTQKMVKNGPKRWKMTFFTTPTWLPKWSYSKSIFLDAFHHLSLFWTKLSEIGGTPTIWSPPKWPKYSQKWWKMAENLHDRKDTKIERKSNRKVIKVIELDLLNCPSMFPSFTRFIWPLRYPKNGEKWSKMVQNNVFHQPQSVAQVTYLESGF